MNCAYFFNKSKEEQNEVDNKCKWDVKVKGKAINVQAYCKTRSVPRSWGPEILRKSAHEGGKDVSFKYQPP